MVSCRSDHHFSRKFKIVLIIFQDVKHDPTLSKVMTRGLSQLVNASTLTSTPPLIRMTFYLNMVNLYFSLNMQHPRIKIDQIDRYTLPITGYLHYGYQLSF